MYDLFFVDLRPKLSVHASVKSFFSVIIIQQRFLNTVRKLQYDVFRLKWSQLTTRRLFLIFCSLEMCSSMWHWNSLEMYVQVCGTGNYLAMYVQVCGTENSLGMYVQVCGRKYYFSRTVFHLYKPITIIRRWITATRTWSTKIDDKQLRTNQCTSK